MNLLYPLEVLQIFLFTVIGVSGISIKSVQVPKYALKGQTVRMNCIYDLQDSRLYSIKWYKDGLEIYRYVPKATRKFKIYPSSYVNVDVDSTKPGAILLRNVQVSSSGIYGCEVSGESPHFHTKYEDKRLIVNDLPSNSPEISGEKSNYKVGDLLNVNCTSPISRPATKILWLINGHPAKRNQMINYPVRYLSDGLQQSQQELKFVVRKEHFKNGRLEIKCAAVLGTRYNRSKQLPYASEYHEDDIISLEKRYFPGSSSEYSIHQTSKCIQITVGVSLALLLQILSHSIFEE